MNQHKKAGRLLLLLRGYTSFFLLMSFVISCSMLLFLNVFGRSVSITYTDDGIRSAAMLTFGNVLFLSLLCTIIDAVRRKFMVDRPVRRIVEGASRLMQGDFSTRIRPILSIAGGDGFNTIIDYDYFNRMAVELGSVETLRTDFIANVSHELKTPLAVMQNYGTLLQSPELSDEKRMEYAKAITESSRRLANLITNNLPMFRYCLSFV